MAHNNDAIFVQQTRFKRRYIMLAFKITAGASITWFSTGTADVFITAPDYRSALWCRRV
jgi:hypothetical protein